jgi:hypothetical protein
MPTLAPTLRPPSPDAGAGVDEAVAEAETSGEVGVGTPVADDSVDGADVVGRFVVVVGAGGSGAGAIEVTSSSSSSSTSVVGSGTVGSVGAAIVSLIRRVEHGRGCQSVNQQRNVYLLPIVDEFENTREIRSRFFKQEWYTPPPHKY